MGNKREKHKRFYSSVFLRNNYQFRITETLQIIPLCFIDAERLRLVSKARAGCS